MSDTWVLCGSPDGKYPVCFNGTEAEMEKVGRSLLERYRKNGFDSPLTVWTGYGWMKKTGPYCEIDENGKRILEAAA